LKNKINIFSSQLSWFCLLVFICIASAANARKYTPQTYIAKFAPIAIQLSIETQIPTTVILGVAIVESGFGNSKNCKLLKNHFGVKGKNTLRNRHKSYRSQYKEYDSDSASFADFCKIVTSRKYYPKIKNSRHNSIWLKHISKTYAKARKRWVTGVLYAIKKYHLGKFNRHQS
jgi:Bax protein